MTDVYRIGVSIMMANGVSPVLATIGRDLLGLNTGIKEVEKGLGRWKLAIGGVAAMMAGGAILGGLYKLAKASTDLSTEQAKLAAAGLTLPEVAKATATAWDVAHTVIGTKVEDNIRAVGHLRAAFGDLNEAMALTPTYQRNAFAISRITGKEGEGEAFKIAQAIHLSGAATDPNTKVLRPDLFAREMKIAVAQIASGMGKLQASDLLLFQKQAGSYGGNLSDEGRIQLTGLIQAVGGQRAGTMLSTANRALKDGVLQKSTLAELERIKLIDAHKVITAHGQRGHGGNGASPGGGIRFMPGALANEAVWRAAPMQWVWQTLIPKLDAAGIHGADAQVNAVQHMKLTANVTRFLSEAIRNAKVDQNEAKNVHKALGVDQYTEIFGKDFGAKAEAFHTAFHNMIVAIGSALQGPVIQGMDGLTKVFNKIGSFASHNPGAIALIGKVIAAVGAALVVAGGIALVAAAVGFVIGGGLAAIIGGIVTAVGALLVLNWGTVKKAVSAAWDWIKGVVGAAGHLASVAWDKLKSAASAVGDFIAKIIEIGRAVLANPVSAAAAAVRMWSEYFHHRDAPPQPGMPKPAPNAGAATPKKTPASYVAANGNMPRPSAAPPAASVQVIHIHNVMKVGERTLAESVNKVNARDLNRAQTSPTSYDPRASLPMSAGYAV